MSVLPQEQPPVNDSRLREWLARMIILINGAFSQRHDFEPLGVMPLKVQNGMVRYFLVNADTMAEGITHEGLWARVNGQWVELHAAV